jgi:hypothetical protein
VLEVKDEILSWIEVLFESFHAFHFLQTKQRQQGKVVKIWEKQMEKVDGQKNSSSPHSGIINATHAL